MSSTKTVFASQARRINSYKNLNSKALLVVNKYCLLCSDAKTIILLSREDSWPVCRVSAALHTLWLLLTRFVDQPTEVSTTCMTLWFQHLAFTVFESEQ